MSRNGELRTSSGRISVFPLKIQVARILSGDKAGRVISSLTRNRVRHQGLWLDVRSDDFSPSVRAMMFWGFYEDAETKMIRSFLRNSNTIVELGSSLGVTTAHAAANMRPGGHLVCVEANPRLVDGLRDRIGQRAPSLRIEVIHAAISDHCGSTKFVVAQQTVSSRVGSPRAGESLVDVPALTLREILGRTGTREFDLVSDIEGAEAAFLLNDPDILAQCTRAVIEFHDTTACNRHFTVNDLIAAAKALGFRVVSRHGPVVALDRR
jgi:FkbM family methyltransferase